MNQSISISVIIPVYRAAECLADLRSRLFGALSKITNQFEVILVNDSSPDNSWEIMKAMASEEPRIKLLNLSRNFGQHYAITAGLSHATKDWIVVMDCDLQDQPEEIAKLLEVAMQGNDVVLAQRLDREDSFLKKSFSKSFYFVLGYLTGTKQDPSVANFGIYHRKVIKAILSSKDHIRYFPSMVRWVGFKTKKVEVKHAARIAGESSYNLKKMLRLALDIILAYSDKPLRLTVKLGLGISFVSFLFGIQIIISALQNKIQVLGYASLMVSIWFFGGLILLVLGVVGLYIGKIFEQVKGRPSFIISESINI